MVLTKGRELITVHMCPVLLPQNNDVILIRKTPEREPVISTNHQNHSTTSVCLD